MTIRTRTLEYTHDGLLLEAFVAWDDSPGKKPGVLVSHAWGGREKFAESKAMALAESGYVGFALDMYGKGVQGANREECAALMAPLKENRLLLQARISVALDTLRSLSEVDPEKTAAIGYCFGGLCVLELALSGADINGVVSFHGLLDRPDNLPSPASGASVLILHGQDDPMVSASDIINMQYSLSRAGCDWQFHSFGNTLHAFSNPVANDPAFGTVYSEKADRRSWRMARDFLQEILA